MNSQSLYASGKFLLSGEYLVLKGATALALPLKLGQYFDVWTNTNNHRQLKWKATVEDKLWFDAVFDLDSLEIIETNDIPKAEYLCKILRVADALNPGFLKNKKGFDILTNINFNINWGLGSSSSLIANIARCFGVDPFKLYFETSNGSGYDVACAQSNTPIFYTLSSGVPKVETAFFVPEFKDNLFFVYLGQKQQSHQSIRDFAPRFSHREVEVERVSEISRELTATHDLEEFEFFVNELEQITAKVLDIPTVFETRFSDFRGSVKSLGAWGGDFVMMTWRDDPNNLKQYLKSKNLHTVFAYDDIVLPVGKGSIC